MKDTSPSRATRDADPRAHGLTVDDDRVLYATCLHEYAHLAVARYFGACGFVTVERPLAERSGAMRWQGRFQLFGVLDDDAWRIVAIAGTLAERLFEDHAADAAQLEAALRQPGALSYCDAALARGFDREDVERCADVLRNAWAAVSGDACERVAEINGRLASPR